MAVRQLSMASVSEEESLSECSDDDVSTTESTSSSSPERRKKTRCSTKFKGKLGNKYKVKQKKKHKHHVSSSPESSDSRRKLKKKEKHKHHVHSSPESSDSWRKLKKKEKHKRHVSSSSKSPDSRRKLKKKEKRRHRIHSSPESSDSRRKLKRKEKHKHHVQSSSSESSESSFKISESRSKRQEQHHQPKQTSKEKCAKERLPVKRKQQITSIFQKNYVNLLRLLKTCSEEVPAEMFSRQLIPAELINAKPSKIMECLNNHIYAEPERIFDTMGCLRKELCSSSILESMEDELRELPSPVSDITKHKKVPSPMQRYKTFLQSRYNKFEVMMDDKLFIVPCNKFIDTVLVKRSGSVANANFSRESESGDSSAVITESKHSSEPITLDTIIEPKDKVVLLEGFSGMGKSTLTWELCRRWDVLECLSKFKLVLRFRLYESRVHNMSTVRDVFHHQDMDLCKKVTKEALKCEGDGILLIFDGFDELPESVIQNRTSLIMELLSGDCLPKSVRLITSRPGVFHQKFPFPLVTKHCEIQGFTEECGSEYMNVAFHSKPVLLHHWNTHVHINPTFNIILTVPICCAILATVYEDVYTSELSFPKTMTELYNSLVLVLIRRFMIQQGMWTRETKLSGSIANLPEPTISAFNSVCKLAFDGFMNYQNMQITFTTNDTGDNFCHLGLMKEAVDTRICEGAVKEYSFYRLSMQEFLAAWHALSCPDLAWDRVKAAMFIKQGFMLSWPERDMQKDFFLDAGRFYVDYEPFLPFLFGLSSMLKHNIKLWNDMCIWVRPQGYLSRVMLGSIYECQVPELVSKLKLRFENITLSSALDMYLFAYVLGYSSCLWNVRAYLSVSLLANLLRNSPNILGSIRELDIRYRKNLCYSEFQYLPLHRLQIFQFIITSSVQSQDASVLISSLTLLYTVIITMKLSQKCCCDNQEKYLRSVEKDFLLFRSLSSLPHLFTLSLTFYGLTSSGVKSLSHLISSCNSLSRVKLTLLDRTLADCGNTPHALDPVLKSLCASPSLRDLSLNFGHEIVSHSICNTNIERLEICLESMNALYNFVTVLNHNLSFDTSLELTLHSELDSGTNLTPFCVGKALRIDDSEICKCHRRSKSLPEDIFYGNNESDDDYSDSSSYSSGDSYELSLAESYSTDGNSFRRRSCPELLYIQELSNMHSVLHKALQTSTLYLQNSKARVYIGNSFFCGHLFFRGSCFSW